MSSEDTVLYGDWSAENVRILKALVEMATAALREQAQQDVARRAMDQLAVDWKRDHEHC